MLGSLVYILLDVSFNILYWTGCKGVSGIGTVYYYLMNTSYYSNNIQQTQKHTQKCIKEDNDNNNDNDSDNIVNIENNNKNKMITKEDLLIIQKQINNQINLIVELKNKINTLEEELINKK